MASSRVMNHPAIPSDDNWKFDALATRRWRQRLLHWYDRNRRDLPWRRDRDPYRVWISEIMLQQTRVSAVLEHYRRFLQRFPTVQKLAAAREPAVLAAWSGLGYYRRARMMHAAAKVIVKEHGGRFPETIPELRALPGIGRYTAAAIASIVFDTAGGGRRRKRRTRPGTGLRSRSLRGRCVASSRIVTQPQTPRRFQSGHDGTGSNGMRTRSSPNVCPVRCSDCASRGEIRFCWKWRCPKN